MTTALPTHPTPQDSPLPDAPCLRLVAGGANGADEEPGSAPLVGYLLLVPPGTDPARLFAEDVARPELRRVAPPAAGKSGRGSVLVNRVQRVVEVDGQELDLTYLEFELLAHLVRHPRQVHSREQLMLAIWGYDHVGDGRTVDVHVARLRRKLGTAHRRRIVTVRRVGYTYLPDEGCAADTAPTHRP